MPTWLVQLIEKAVILIITEVMASHGIEPKAPPAPPSAVP